MKLPRPTRRQVLLGGLATGALAAGGVAFVATAEASAFFRAMMQDALPGTIFSDTAFDTFTVEIQQNRNPDFAVKLRILSAMNRTIGYSGIKAVVGASWKYEVFQRGILTAFMLGSNFFQLNDPSKETIEYNGISPGCANPFAQLVRA